MADKPVEVDVVATLVTPGTRDVKFTLEPIPAHSHHDHPSEKNGLIFRRQTDRNRFKVTFNLVDHTGYDIIFRDEIVDAIWITPGTHCPTGPGDGGDCRLGTAGTKKLFIFNHNSIQQKLTHMLRFTAGSGPFPREYELDPVIENGGGGIPPFHHQLWRLLAHLLSAIGLAKLAERILR